MSIVVGTLTIDLKANTASFSEGMEKMSNLSARTANDVKRSLEKVAAAGLAMGAAIVGGTTELIKKSLESADAMGKMAQKTGTTVETLSVLGYAAKLADVETETLGKGLEKLSQAMFKAQNGNVQMQRIFDRLGVSTRDANGHLRDSGLVLEDLAVKFAGMRDDSGAKPALAMAIFGKSGAAMIPLLNELGEHLKEINEEAHRFGLVLSKSTTEVAAEAHDKLKKLGALFTGMGYSLLSAVLPALDQLAQKLLDIASKADIPGLARSFGAEVVKGVTLLGNALEFAATHAHALKLALEAMAAMKLATIALPLIGDIQKGGTANLGKGLDKLTMDFFGLERALPVLKKFGTWVSDTTKFVGLLASEEGVASAATYVLDGAMAAMGGPIGIAIGAVVALGVALYKFRASTFSLFGTTYQLRDIWNAAWLLMKDVVGALGSAFSDVVSKIKKLWTEAVDWIKGSSIGKFIADDFADAETRLEGHLKHFAEKVAGPGKGYLDRAKAQREGVDPRFLKLIDLKDATEHKADANTAGLEKPKRDPYGEEMDKLKLAIDGTKAYINVLDGSADAIEKVVLQEKANAVALEVNRRMKSELGHGMSAEQEAALKQRVMDEERLKTLKAYGDEIEKQKHSTELNIRQTKLLADVTGEGDAAVRQATIDNAMLALTYNRTTAELAAMQPYLQEQRKLLMDLSSAELAASVAKDMDSMRDQTEAQERVTGAILGTIDARREAELRNKTARIDEDINSDLTKDADRVQLILKRGAIIALTKAEQEQQDAERALSLLSPAEQYARQTDEINHAAAALVKLQGTSLDYWQTLQLEAQQQDALNKKIEQQVQLLLKSGSAADGAKAFFLEMTKQAQTGASMMYDAYKKAFDGIAENLTNLAITGKQNFAKMFQDIGKQLLNDSIKKAMQEGLAGLFGGGKDQQGGKDKGLLGALGGVLGKGLTKADGSSKASALWVRMADGGIGGGMGADNSDDGSDDGSGGDGLKGLFSKIFSKVGGILGKIGGFFGSLFGGGGGGGGGGDDFGGGLASGGHVRGPGSGTSDSIFARLSNGEFVVNARATARHLALLHAINGKGYADGGLVGAAYAPGEMNIGMMGSASTRVASAAKAGPAQQVGDHHYYTIDARGTDPHLTEQRVRAAIRASHDSAIATSMKGQHELQQRMPHR